MAQFYSNKPVPKNILINADVNEKTILEKALKTKINKPLQGSKKDLVKMAERNAKEAFLRKQALEADNKEIFKKLADYFNLKEIPKHIEVYDNSHISGKHAVGAMVVVGAEGFQKNSYRKFNMPDGMKGDDFAMMHEMLTRRFKSEIAPPDIILIDGGQGQLNIALKVIKELKIKGVTVVAIAKGVDRNAGRERFFLPNKKPVQLDEKDPVLYFLQNIRDEVHRFVITSHRAKRSKAIIGNILDEVPKIGAKRKKLLLIHFGSAKAVAEAGVIDLQKVEGISKNIAETIYNFFHEGK